MSIRLDVQLDYGSESTRYVASATLDGEFLHGVGKYGGPEVCGEVFREMAAWLKGQAHQAPDQGFWCR